MAHFAKLDNTNTVIGVQVVHNDIATSEQAGIDFLNQLYGESCWWKQTSYNGNFRKNYAGIGYLYDSNRDAFIGPREYVSWILNETTCRWEPPVAYPDDGKRYAWHEATTSWDEIT